LREQLSQICFVECAALEKDLGKMLNVVPVAVDELARFSAPPLDHLFREGAQLLLFVPAPPDATAPASATIARSRMPVLAEYRKR